MILTLELSREQETILTAAADAEGVSITDYALHRLFNGSEGHQPTPRPSVTPERRAQLEAEAARAFAASDMTEEEVEEIAVQAVKRTRVEMRAEQAHA